MKKLNYLLIPFFVFSATIAHAGIKLGSNRLIYDGSKSDATMVLNNDDSRPFLVQAWGDAKGNPLLEGKSVPFMVTPPLFQIEPGAENLVQLLYLGSGLPSDRESLTWLNIKSVPAIKDSEKNLNNKMLLAVSNRIKVFYRPASLKGKSSAQVTENLVWKKGDGNTLVATNNSPFYVVMNKVIINGKAVTVSIEQNNTVVPPFGEKKFPLEVTHKQLVTVTWSGLNDYSIPTKDYSVQIAW